MMRGPRWRYGGVAEATSLFFLPSNEACTCSKSRETITNSKSSTTSCPSILLTLYQVFNSTGCTHYCLYIVLRTKTIFKKATHQQHKQTQQKRRTVFRSTVSMVELDSNGKTLVSLKNLAAERYWDMRWQREWQTKYHDPQGVSCDHHRILP